MDDERLDMLEARVDDLATLADRIEELEDGRMKLLEEVKDIMTVFENRVLKEIESLAEGRIEPMDKVISGLMLTVSDIMVKFTAFLDVYETSAPEGFAEEVNKMGEKRRKEVLQELKDVHGALESELHKQNSNETPDGNANDNQASSG